MRGRGALIVFEGCDRCGKSTQSNLLTSFLKSNHIDVNHRNFPARTTPSGKLINSYLTQSQDLPDESIHLLFSVNRWEAMNEIKNLLETGTTVVVDRYSYSGVAYSAAKGLDYNWCKAPEQGLIRPDMVFYLKTGVDLLSARSEFGAERYEKCELQKKVALMFDRIYQEESSYWLQVDGTESIENIHEKVAHKTLEIIKDVQNKPIQKLW